MEFIEVKSEKSKSISIVNNVRRSACDTLHLYK